MDVALKARLYKVVGFVNRHYTRPCLLKNAICSYSLKTHDKMATADVVSLLSNPRPVVGVCQMTSTSDKDKNFMKARSLLERCKALGAKMVFFPEACDYIADNKQQSMMMAECLNGEIMTKYMQLAKEKSVWISIGGFHQKSSDPESKKLYNTHVIIDDQGEIRSTYSKAHMFDLDIQGKIRLCESDYTIQGDRIGPPVQTPVGKIGLAICYDVRFPELSIALRNLGAEILTFPSAFTVPTGMAHWHVLLRNRAIETQSYVIAAAQTGRHNDSRASYGHSMIVDPWGTIVAECPDGESVCVAEIDLDYLTKVRTQMPVQHHKRLDLYGEINLSMRDCDIDKQTQYDFGTIQIGSRQVFYKTSLSYAFVNIKPIVPGHVLVASLRNVTRFYELEPCEVSDLFNTVQVVSKVIEKHFKGTSVTISIQDGPEAGQTVKHVHVHVIPRIQRDFPQNDSIYMKLQNHDKNLEEERQQGNLRTVDQMCKEAAELRAFFN